MHPLSREPYPYSDIWDPGFRTIDAFGIDRCLWGTDWTRAVDLLTSRQGVDAVRATNRSDSDKSQADTARLHSWSPRERERDAVVHSRL